VAVDVGIDDADAAARLGERDRQVDRHRGLADAALAAGDREHLGQRPGLGERDLLGRLTTAQLSLERGALLVGHRPQRQLDRAHALDAAEGRADVAVDGVLQRASRHGEQHRDPHDARCVDLEMLDHAQLGDRPLDLGVVDGGQGGGQPLDGGGAHGVPSVVGSG
jgi:hypothetical protein